MARSVVVQRLAEEDEVAQYGGGCGVAAVSSNEPAGAWRRVGMVLGAESQFYRTWPEAGEQGLDIEVTGRSVM